VIAAIKPTMKAKLVAVAAVAVISLVLVQPVRKVVRIKDIDAQLANWAPTGRSVDAQRHTALQTERAALAADLSYLGYSTSTVVPASAPVVAATPVYGAPYSVVAPVSRANRWESMADDSNWMDTNKQTHYRSRGYYTSPHP
jgi:hypothetical protein